MFGHAAGAIHLEGMAGMGGSRRAFHRGKGGEREAARFGLIFPRRLAGAERLYAVSIGIGSARSRGARYTLTFDIKTTGTSPRTVTALMEQDGAGRRSVRGTHNRTATITQDVPVEFGVKSGNNDRDIVVDGAVSTLR